MANTIAITVKTDRGSITVEKTITANHLARMLAAYKLRLGPKMEDAEALRAWADRVFSETKREVLDIELSAARAEISEIDLA
jgi:hypothetical protein